MSSRARSVIAQVSGSGASIRSLVRLSVLVHVDRVFNLNDWVQKRGTSACELLPSLAHLIPD